MSMKEAFTFTREQSSIFITLYKNNPILHDAKHELYKNKAKRAEALNAMAEQFNDYFPMVHITSEDCRKKINSLRTQFFAELKKVKKSMVSGESLEDVYKPTLWCFERLLFLNDNAVKKEIQSPDESILSEFGRDQAKVQCEQYVEAMYNGIDELSENELDANLLSSGSSHSNISEEQVPRPSKRKKPPGDYKDTSIKLMEMVTNLVAETKTPAAVTASEAFGIMVSVELGNIKNPARRRSVQRKILDVLHEALDEEAGQ